MSVFFLQLSSESVDTMCQIMEEYAEKRAKQAAQIAEKQVSIDVATRLWDEGFRDYQQIAKITFLPRDEVKKLFDGKSA